jgi:twitching motility two-component system response regulator PilG
MLTARDGAFDKVQGRLAGATEYLTKPFDGDKLREVIGKFINIKP